MEHSFDIYRYSGPFCMLLTRWMHRRIISLLFCPSLSVIFLSFSPSLFCSSLYFPLLSPHSLSNQLYFSFDRLYSLFFSLIHSLYLLLLFLHLPLLSLILSYPLLSSLILSYSLLFSTTSPSYSPLSSLFSQSAGLATGVSAGVSSSNMESNSMFSLFNVTVYLTTKGTTHSLSRERTLSLELTL